MQKLSDFDKFISFRNEIFGVRIFKGGGGVKKRRDILGGGSIFGDASRDSIQIKDACKSQNMYISSCFQ